MKSNMVIDLLIGAAVGFVGGYIVRKQLTKNEAYNESGNSYRTLLQEAQREIQTLKNRVSNLQNENESLINELKSLKIKIRNADDASDDQADRLMDLNRRIETLKREKEITEEKLQESKDLYTSAMQEIERLKSKM
jgi:chromosome segregation ATPase